MAFNKGYELKKFEARWEKLRIEYAAAGMTEYAIQKMYDYDRQQFNSERTFVERTQEFTAPAYEGSEEEASPLMLRYQEALPQRIPITKLRANLHGSVKSRTSGCCLLLKIYRKMTSNF